MRDGERCWIVRAADIFLLESEGNYTRLYFSSERPLIPRSLVLFRAGRRHIVNLKWVEKVDPGVAGNLGVTLRSGQTVEPGARSQNKTTCLREFWLLASGYWLLATGSSLLTFTVTHP